MKTILLIAIGVLISNVAFTQASAPKIKMYKAKIHCIENKKLVKGILYNYNDSTIILIDAKTKYDIINNRFQLHGISVSSIKKIKVRRNGQVGTFALLGALSGAAFGTVYGLIQGDDLTPCTRMGGCLSAGDKAALLGIPLAFVGGIAGAIAGTPSKHIEIDGQRENIIDNQELLNKYSIFKQNENSQ